MEDETVLGEEITPEGSAAPVYLVPLTPEEIDDREQLALEQAERLEAAEARLAARESAIAKLAALGLTEEEVSALIQ